MDKYQIAKEITVALISDKTKERLSFGDPDLIKENNDRLAENVAAFFNAVVEKLNIP